MRRIKRGVNLMLHVFGLHMSRYSPPRPVSVRKVPPSAEDVFGHQIYQNVHDIVDYSGLSHVPMNRFGRWDGEDGFCINEVKPGQTVLDIGASIGFFTLLLARLVGPSGRVFAFEPDTVSFALLKANVLVNGHRNVTLVNKAVTATTGVQKLYVCPTGDSAKSTLSEWMSMVGNTSPYRACRAHSNGTKRFDSRSHIAPICRRTETLTSVSSLPSFALSAFCSMILRNVTPTRWMTNTC